MKQLFYRPKTVKLDQPVACCGSPTVLDINGVYRCPCGQRHEREVAAYLRKVADDVAKQSEHQSNR